MVIFFLLWFLMGNPEVPEFNFLDIKKVEIGGQNIDVDISITKEEHKQGLSNRHMLQENEGMLFVFEYSGRHSFWMKDMFFPIDIIWIGENMKVVFKKDNILPETYPKIYTPEVDAKYVLEVVSGFSKKNNIHVGDEVSFTN